MRRYAAEFIGSLFLLMIIVGSGVMGERLAGGNEAIALLANSLATGAGLFVLIQCLGPISGAHVNPVVSLTEALWGRLNQKDLIGYWAAQFSGAIAGVFLTHAMFGLPIFEVSRKHREGLGLGISEFVATFGLISVIGIAGKKHVERVPVAIAAYITAAYWFTSSTAFANPAVTVARALTDTFCGIAPQGILLFVLAQSIAAVSVFGLSKTRLR